jgi:hypothetical protein
MKKYLALLALVIVLGASAHIVYLYTHREFGPGDFNHPYVLTRGSSIPDEESKQLAQEILKQKFSYLGCGKQMTAYESEDRCYVIKFFNPRSVLDENWFHRPTKLIRFNSLKWIWRVYFQQKDRLERYFYRYELSFKDLKDETALLYVHLDAGTALPQTIAVESKEGVLYHLNATTHPFVLQKKVEMTMTRIDRLMNTGKVEEAKESVRQIFALFHARAKKGYKDKLQYIHKNYGFIGDKAIQFDTGRIRMDKAVLENPKKELERVVSNIKPALAAYPELVETLEESLVKSL